jgi:chemotaxis protein CheX
MSMTLTVDTIIELTRETWTALVTDGQDLLHDPPDVVHAGDIMASVEITGAWNGTACLGCSQTAAFHDAIGELINVVGGNIKSLLPGPTELSLPTVHGDGAFTVDGQLEKAFEVRFSWMNEPLMVTVWTSEAD